MVIAITGAGGFIGRNLISYMESLGYKTVRIPRINSGTETAALSQILTNADVVINLAGAPIVSRWNKSYKKELFDSRIITTRKIVEAITLMRTKPGLLISASAIGIYSSEGEQTELKFQPSDDFLHEICANWEMEACKAVPLLRVAIIRLGIVLGRDGGALQKMLPLFKIGLGGKIGSGRQGFSWIHIDDLVRAVVFMISRPELSGAFNFTAPEVSNNGTFTKILAGVLKKPALLTVPSFALKLLFGEGAIAVLGGQFAPPEHLMDEGFQFNFPALEEALKNIISND